MSCNSNKTLRQVAKQSTKIKVRGLVMIRSRYASAVISAHQMLLYVNKNRRKRYAVVIMGICLHAMVSFAVMDQAVIVGRSPW
jgi:hypothetical protein